MSARGSTGWQTALADLSLILFMMMAAAVNGSAAKPTPVKATSRPAADGGNAQPTPQAEPLAIWIDAGGAPPLADWIAAQAGDPRQQLTVTARYAPGPDGQARALAEAARLVRAAGQAGYAARLVIEPGQGPGRAELAFDGAAIGR